MPLTADQLRAHAPLLPGGIRILNRLLSLEEARQSSTDPLSPTRLFTLPDAGISYALDPCGLIRRGIRALDLEILARRNQLQFLHAFRVKDQHLSAPPPHTFSHTRFDHSCGAAVIAAPMMAELGLDATMVKLGLLAEITHDRMMPAGGDAMKNYAHNHGQLRLYDEDDNFCELFSRQSDPWQALCREERLPADAIRIIAGAVRSKGILGHIHDIADTSSYLTLDLAHLAEQCHYFWGKDWPTKAPVEYQKAFALAERGACRLWEVVATSGDDLVITDTDRLNDFLTLRALLWRYLYHHPATKFLESVHTEILFPYLARKSLIARDQVVHWDDHRLNQLVARVFGFTPDQIRNVNFLGQTPKREFFVTRERALAVEEDQAARGHFTLLRDHRDLPPINTKTNKYYVRGPNGLQTFARAYPEDTHRIQAITREPGGVYLYVIEGATRSGRMSDTLRRAWQTARRTWRKHV